MKKFILAGFSIQGTDGDAGGISHDEKDKETTPSCYVATLDAAPDSMADPRMAFAFCYIASHLGVGLVNDEEATGILEYVEEHLYELRRMILNGGPM